jgi:propionate CoA-transferase
VRMLADVTAMQLYCIQIAKLDAVGKLGPTLAGLAKLHNTSKARGVLADARDMLGGNGILLDFQVQMVINYDNFYLVPDLTDDYVTVIHRLADRHYDSVSRYTTSSFMRLKLTQQLSRRGLAPHIYESRQEAMNWRPR